MTNYLGLAAVGQSIERYLNFCFQEESPIPHEPPDPPRPVNAKLVTTADLADPKSNIEALALSIFLYGVNVNAETRAAWSAVAHHDGRPRLPLDLHYLLTPWGADAVEEHRILGRAMQCLEATPSLSGPLLDPMADWAPGESVQICLAELTTEDAMRTFDTLPLDYKLSVHYLARVVRIDHTDAFEEPIVSTAATGVIPSILR